MIMATSTPVNNSSAKLGFFRKHWWKIGVSLLFITALVFLGYNKYLDRQNVTDIKQLLSDFEKLKTDVESETGEKLVIGVKCGDLEEKFIKTPACYIFLESSRETPTDLNQALSSSLSVRLAQNDTCGSFGGVGFVFSNSKKVIFSCYPFVIGSNSRADIEKLTNPYAY